MLLLITELHIQIYKNEQKNRSKLIGRFLNIITKQT